MKCLIVSGGNAPSSKIFCKYVEESDYMIAADKGIETFYKNNVIPNMLVGDFDSANKHILAEMSTKIDQIKKLNPEKDYPDTWTAINEAIEKGAEKIYLLGATGTRLDHTLGNIGLLMMAKDKGIELEIIDNNNKIYLAKKNKMKIYGEFGETISFHALSDCVKNFTIKGAKYNLESYDMSLLYPRALCNEFLDTPIEISYDEGELLILHSID